MITNHIKNMFEKGKSGNPKGRPPGPNKTTKEIREAYQKFVEDNIPEFTKWLNKIEDPAKRFDTIIKLSEYFIPKLARQEITGSEGRDLFENIVVKFNTAPEKKKED